MSYNGSGTFLINSAGQPVVANTVISATVFNALTSDLATGLSTAITKDGQTTITANIPFGSNKITGLGSGTAATDAANLGQVQSTAAKLVTVTGTDTITGSMSPQLTAYAAGQLFYFVAAGANTGAVTINIDGLGAKSITRDGSTALANGDINSGEVVVLVYDGTRFQMINAANSFGNTTINGTLTVTGNTGLQANVSITSTLSVGGTFAVTGAATLGSTLAVTGKSDLPTVSTASINAAVALITTGTVTNLTASGASIASANIGNLQFTAASIASINAGVAVVTNLTATSASIASANVGTAVITTGTVTNLTSTSASVASANAAVALVTTGTVTNLTSTSASIASANVGTAVVTGLTVTGASIASLNAGTATITTGNLTFSGTTQRITGDFSNATLASRLAFQTSTTNGVTNVGAIPNGTATISGFRVYSGSDPNNATIGQILQNGSSETQIRSDITGTGTYAPMTFLTGGSERMRLDTSGNLGIGTASPAVQVHATGVGRFLQLQMPNNAGTYTSGSAGFHLFGFSDNNLYFNWFDAGAIVFRNNGTSERMRIDSSGNVGIGTASPTFKLVAANSGTDGGWMYSTGTVSVLGLGGYAGAGDGAFQIRYDRSTGGITFNGGTRDTPAARIAVDNIGNVGIGGTGEARTKVTVTGTLPTSGTQSFGFNVTGTIPSGTTSGGYGYSTGINTEAASFTLTELRHYNASQATIGAGSTVTNQFGFIVNSNLTGATNNYGFYSNIASGSNRWNFYANGTARNYFAGGVEVVSGTTGMTTGFTHIPGAAGVPTGAPTNPSGNFPMYFDSTNNRIYVYNGTAWRYATTT